jgi:GNAT superfamily N-acetyltransferase
MDLIVRLATVRDVDAVVRVLVATKEASFPDTTDDHDRDIPFWTRRWRGYIVDGSRAQKSLGDGWVFIAETGNGPVGYVAYHHSTRLGTDAELQNIYVLKEAQGRGIGTRLLGVVAHRLHADGSRSLCVGYDANSPYRTFYLKHGAHETGPGAPWAIWPDVAALAARVPKPGPLLLGELRRPSRTSLIRRLWP